MGTLQEKIPEAFRLLRTEIADNKGLILRVDFTLPSGEGSWTTLLTGRNGIGKSRILAAIAAAFDALDGHKPRRPMRVSVVYAVDGHKCCIRLENRTVSGFLDGIEVPTEKMPRPQKVVAVTTSAFDKFELPSSQKLFGPATPRNEIYQYLGLKDARGRVSTKSGVFRALENLFEATALDEPRRVRIAHVFEYLGYLPQVEVIYRWTRRGRSFLKAGENEGSRGFREFLEQEREDRRTSERPIIGEYFFDEPAIIDQLGRAAYELNGLNSGKDVVLTAEFSSLNWSADHRFRQAQQLVRARLIEMREVNFRRRNNGLSVSINDASSGELAIATTMLGIASTIDDKSLVLIDEPEISLHPAWQTDYLQRLTETFEKFSDCHFVIATHSATLVSGAHPERSNVIDMESSAGIKSQIPSGKSTDEVLVRTFGVSQDGNLYLRQLLVEALRLVTDQRAHEHRFLAIMMELKSVEKSLPNASSIRQLIKDLEKARITNTGATA